MQLRHTVFLSAFALVSCGDSAGSDGSADASGTSSTGIATSATSNLVDGSGSGSAESVDDGETSSDENGDGTIRWDIPVPDADLSCGAGGGGGATDFSYIWIANSNEGTISKINTQTLVEEGRYIVRPDANGNPSRTSVNLNGDVVVANRSGGVTMISASVDGCPDPNNTSSGPNDVKPWPDGCVVWHTPFNYSSQRPVAWTQGVWNDATCRYDDAKVWTSGATGSIDVLLLEGDDGTIIDTVNIAGVSTGFYGIYGAAVDADGNFWGSQLSQGKLVNVDLVTFDYQVWQMPTSGYGMTVDSQGYVWTCSHNAARFDPSSETWDVLAGAGGQGGCMEDGNGTLWMANDPMVGVDINAMQVVQQIDLPNYVHGISIDFQGYVWGPAIYANEAYRVDPVNLTIDTVLGLNYPYTYSDMTGFALSNAGTPSG